MKLTDLDIIVTAPPAPGWGGALLDFDQAHHRYGLGRLGGILCLERGPDRHAGRHSRCF